MRYVICVSIILMVGMFLGGCGGSSPLSELGSGTFTKSGRALTEPVSLEQLAADLAAVGKPMPDFLLAPQPVPEVSRVMLPVLSINVWVNNQTVSRGRVSWFEANCSSASYPYDVTLRPTAGDPDLYVFTPFRGARNIQLIGSSTNASGDDHVGSFYPSDWDGAGRFLVGVHGYSGSTIRFNLRLW